MRNDPIVAEVRKHRRMPTAELPINSSTAATA